ncbi:MAG: hypothetical protein CME16_02145 [Gemmatimonadetes bacterium]|nr:hypothetical protein [Gemmatimonadota bacterium]
MNNFSYILISLLFIACNTQNSDRPITDDDNAIFERNWKAFEQHHVGGVISKDIDHFMALYSDSVKWSPPNWNGNVILGKEDLKSAAQFYMDNFDEISFKPGGAIIGADGAYFGGSLFSDVGNTSNSPNRLRIHGVWSGKHVETGAPFHLKFFIIQEFNEDGEVITLNEWFDPSSIGDQIDTFLSKQSK